MSEINKQYLDFLMRNEIYFYECADYVTVEKVRKEIKEFLKQH